METQNMELLDLQTGKYLELGEKGFFYGGKTITCPPTKSFDIQNVDRDMTLHIYADTEKDYDIKCLDDSHSPLFEITLKSNNKKLIGREVRHIDMRFNRVIEQTEPPLELKEVCEKVGAVVYGDRYVLLENEECGNVYSFSWKSFVDYFVDFKNAEGNFSQSTTFYEQNFNSRLLGNIFEEYSKQLRNEPNKFDELKQYFK